MMQPHLYPTENPVNTLLECVTAGDVCDSVVNGKILMRDRKLQTIDEMEVIDVYKRQRRRRRRRSFVFFFFSVFSVLIKPP